MDPGIPGEIASVWEPAPGVGNMDVGGATVWGINAVAGAALYPVQKKLL